MPDIRIDRFRIRADASNWILSEVKRYESGKRKGQEYDASPTFYPRLQQALTALIDRGLRESDAETVAELKQDLMRLRSEALRVFGV